MAAYYTGLNAIELICSDGKRITSRQGPYGSWGHETRCSKGFVNGFMFKAQSNQGMMYDDTAANAIRLVCNNGERLTSLEGSAGYWSSYKYCPAGMNVCGIKTQVDQNIYNSYSYDETALNNVGLYCCNI